MPERVALPSRAAIARSRRTLRSYEAFAPEYNTLVSALPPRPVAAALRRFVKAVARGAHVLEVGSGPGRDADFVESFGVSVRRTDATPAFLELQAARGRHGDRLDLLTDPLGGPYDGVLAMFVLIHIERDVVPLVLRKIAAALRPGGMFLAAMREGRGQSAGKYCTTYWSRGGFAKRLSAAGFEVVWDDRYLDEDGDACLTFLARAGGAELRAGRRRSAPRPRSIVRSSD